MRVSSTSFYIESNYCSARVAQQQQFTSDPTAGVSLRGQPGNHL
jgi:hypothetical protein